jgi:succinoglycan biosynthesis transport protein ExoP
MAGAPGRRDGGASVRPPIPPHRDVPAASRDRLAGAVVKYPMSSYAEAIRVTRTALRHSPSGNPPKIVLITSSVPGEGKTSLAISLARSSAMSGLRTLLIDADIRRPRIGAIFGAKSPGTSLIDYLEDTADYGAIVHRDRETMMDYVTGRLGVANSLDLLSSEKFAELLRHAQSQYDAIYLDSSPVLAVADPTVLARMADGVAFVIRWGETTEQVALSAMKLLQSSGADIAGTVLSCVNVQKLASYRAGGTGYYFGRYPSYYST